MECNHLIFNNKFLYCLFLLQLVYCSYEDKADKFGSKQEYIGKVKFAYIDPLIAGTHRFVVATEENVVACLSTRTGSIIWKQNLGKGKPGEIDVLSEKGDLITVNGGGQFVRSWDQTTGELLWETTFPHPRNSEAVSYFTVNTLSKEIIKIEILPKKHAKVYVFNYARASLKPSDNIASHWFDEGTKCNFFSSRYFVCMEPDKKVLQRLYLKDTSVFTPIHLTNISDDVIPNVKIAKLVSVPYQDLLKNPYAIIQTDNSTVVMNINPPEFSLVKTVYPYHNVMSAVFDNGFVLMGVIRFNDRSNENSTYNVGAILAGGVDHDILQLEGTCSVSKQRGELLETFILPYIKKDHGIGYKLLLQFEDNSLLLYDQQGKLIWSREEALSNVDLNIHRARSEEL